MAELLLGESKLEQYLKEQPLRQGASPRGPRPQLTEVRKHLTATLDRGNLKVPWASGMRGDSREMLAPYPLTCVVGGDPRDELGDGRSTSTLPWLVFGEAGQLAVQLMCQPLCRLTSWWGLLAQYSLVRAFSDTLS